jgi:peptidoglycan/LPS O-acetylase OafA/YrhL
VPDRPPAERPHFELFDALRGIAVLSVITFHVASITDKLGRGLTGRAAEVLGAQAVIVFFVISGFLLYRPFVAARVAGRREPSLRRFGRRRAGRILPAYWVALTLLALYPGITGVFSDDGWRYYGFLQLYSTDTINQGIPVAWTLCVEVTFYLALPLWALAMRRRGVRGELAALAALAAFGAAVQVAAGREAIDDMAAQSLLGQSAWFALGMVLAVVSVAEAGASGRSRARLRVVAAHPGLCWAGACAAFVALVALRAQPNGLFGILIALQTVQPYPKLLAEFALTALILALVLAPAVWDTPARLPQRVLAAKPLAWLGLISYGVFLWHLTIAELLILPERPHDFAAAGLGLGDRMAQGATPILLAATLAASCAVAALSYRFVELPFLRRKER